MTYNCVGVLLSSDDLRDKLEHDTELGILLLLLLVLKQRSTPLNVRLPDYCHVVSQNIQLSNNIMKTNLQLQAGIDTRH